jgi:hypothetical protein
VEIAPGVEVQFARPAIARVVPAPADADESVVPDDEELEAYEEPAPIESPVVETRKSKD